MLGRNYYEGKVIAFCVRLVMDALQASCVLPIRSKSATINVFIASQELALVSSKV